MDTATCPVPASNPLTGSRTALGNIAFMTGAQPVTWAGLVADNGRPIRPRPAWFVHPAARPGNRKGI